MMKLDLELFCDMSMTLADEKGMPRRDAIYFIHRMQSMGVLVSIVTNGFQHQVDSFIRLLNPEFPIIGYGIGSAIPPRLSRRILVDDHGLFLELGLDFDTSPCMETLRDRCALLGITKKDVVGVHPLGQDGLDLINHAIPAILGKM